MALGQDRTIYLTLVNGSGQTKTPGPLAGPPTLGEYQGSENKTSQVIMSRGEIIAKQEGDEQEIEITLSVFDQTNFDGTASDLINYIQFSGDYAASLPYAQAGNAKTFLAYIDRTVNGRTPRIILGMADVKVSGKGAPDANTWDITVKGKLVSRA